MVVQLTVRPVTAVVVLLYTPLTAVPELLMTTSSIRLVVTSVKPKVSVPKVPSLLTV